MSRTQIVGDVGDIDRELHDLSQPLTSLMCQLELGKMMGDAESMAVAVDGALLECRRLFDGFAAMRNRLAGRAGETEGTA